MFNIICYCSMGTVVCVWSVLPRSLFGASCRILLYLCHAFFCQVATSRLELEALAGLACGNILLVFLFLFLFCALGLVSLKWSRLRTQSLPTLLPWRLETRLEVQKWKWRIFSAHGKQLSQCQHFVWTFPLNHVSKNPEMVQRFWKIKKTGWPWHVQTYWSENDFFPAIIGVDAAGLQ